MKNLADIINKVHCAVKKPKTYKSITVNGKQVRLHRHVMEMHLGRKLTENELVHHVNGDIYDNRIENLEVVSRSQHLTEKHPEILKMGQFKNVHNISESRLLELYPTHTWQELAIVFGCSVSAIQYWAQKHKIRERVKCHICGEWARYRKAQLCAKHYHQKYYQDARCTR